MIIVTVTQLRKAGVRLENPNPPAQGYLRTNPEGRSTGVSLISDRGGISLAGPLYDPKLVKADVDGFILLGFERNGEAAVVQEWLIKQAPVGNPTGYSSPPHQPPKSA